MECLKCGKLHENAKFCSRACAGKAKQEIKQSTWKCKICGEFDKPRADKQYKICDECRVKVREKSKNTCEWYLCLNKCMSNKARYCSKNCASKAKVTKSRRDLKKKAIAIMGGACERCGYTKCIGALHFHHTGNDKAFAISAKGYSVGWDRVIEELKKCILICANCHAEEHFKDQNELETIVPKFERIAKNKKVMRLKACERCEKVFNTNNSSKKFCSDECRLKNIIKVKKQKSDSFTSHSSR